MNPELLKALYAAFNAREIDTVLARLHPDVEWPNGWEGGYLQGTAAVREYWLRQWAAIDPRVEPVGFATDADGRVVVTVHQIVRDKQGNVLADENVEHVYRIEDGLVRHMEIRKS